MDKKYKDRMVMHHTLRIDLLDGTWLAYELEPYEKSWLEEYLYEPLSGEMGMDGDFLVFITAHDRVVYLKVAEVARFIFLEDVAVSQPLSSEAIDNFNVRNKEEGNMKLPQVIVKLKGSREALTYDDINCDTHAIHQYYNAISYEDVAYLRFIPIIDEDGEMNFIPMQNTVCMEVDRKMVMNDTEWAAVLRDRDLDNRKN